MPSADSGLRHALIDSNLIASRAARIFIGQLAEHGQIMLGVNDTILEEARRALRNRTIRRGQTRGMNKGKFWESAPEYADAKGPLEAWYFEVIRASWITPQELKAQFGSASILKNSRVVFNIAGNKYRLVVAIDYRRQACFVKFIGTHKQYDTIDAETYDGYSTHKK